METCKASDDRDVEMARVIAGGGVSKVVLTGGEPLLARSITKVAQVLKEGGVSVSIHTHGPVDGAILESWRGIVDDVALPIDSTDSDIQSRLRSPQFVEQVSTRIDEQIGIIRRYDINVGLHTVFTSLNFKEIPGMCRRLCRLPFSYWRIYEYNEDLARMRWLKSKKLGSEKQIAGYLMSEELAMPGDPRIGQTDGLEAEFLLMEPRIRDPRVQFVPRDSRGTYCFLRPNGDFVYYKSHSTDRRIEFANLFKDGLPKVREKWQEVVAEPSDNKDSSTFFEREWERPLWLRQYLGCCWFEEIDDIDGRSWPKIVRLERLWRIKHGEKV
jgi:MoaA/NifB/PqqE/SkfB family radical SAM enzyme